VPWRFLDACQLSVPRASLLPASKNLHNFGHRTGGAPSLGYQARDRKLVIVDGEAEIGRSIFRRYAELGSVRLLEDEPVEGRAC
jgi:hypothetical protein